MEKVDLLKEHKDEYVMPKKPVLIRTRRARYLSFTGRGAPSGELFQNAIQAMFSVAYSIKMTRKFSGENLPDYKVCTLEALWWADDETKVFAELKPEEWNWQLLIRTPDFITKKELKAAQAAVIEKKGIADAAKVEFISVAEGPAVQMLHIGPYNEEGRTVCQMKDFAEANGCELHGRHHEIYMSDPRRVKPEKLKTILRVPVRRAAQGRQ